MIYAAIAFIPFFLSWGSFLNVVAYRLVHNGSLLAPRSYCPHCRHTLSWNDLIPVISWLWLKGACRYCQKPISFLYPFIELLTACIMSLLVAFGQPYYIFAYFIFFSALIVTIRSDLQTMLISRYVSLFLVPLGILFSVFNLLPITPLESIVGALVGYGLLYCIGKIFYWITHKEGMGQGDIDLLAFIGSFVGAYGCWMTLLLGSLTGSVIGVIYTLIAKPGKFFKIPFGPFLALGAIIYVLCKEQLLLLFFVH